MKFNELDNEEIVFIHTLLGDMLSAYDTVIKEKGMFHYVDSPLGKLKIFQEIDEEGIAKLNASDKLRLFRSITSKLYPIIELIADSQPELIDNVEAILFPTNDSEEEDM